MEHKKNNTCFPFLLWSKPTGIKSLILWWMHTFIQFSMSFCRHPHNFLLGTAFSSIQGLSPQRALFFYCSFIAFGWQSSKKKKKKNCTGNNYIPFITNVNKWFSVSKIWFYSLQCKLSKAWSSAFSVHSCHKWECLRKDSWFLHWSGYWELSWTDTIHITAKS